MTASLTISRTLSLLDIAESDNAVFIHLDKTLLNEKKIKAALKLLREFQARHHTPDAEENTLPPIDLTGIPAMSDEEQAEVEAMLDSLTDEDKEVAFVRRVRL